MWRLIFVISLSALLFGCGAKEECETFGVRDSIWKALTPQQQNIIIKSHTRDKERAEAQRKKRNSD